MRAGKKKYLDVWPLNFLDHLETDVTDNTSLFMFQVKEKLFSMSIFSTIPHIEPQSRCGHLGGSTCVNTPVEILICVATSVEGTTHVDTYMSSCVEASSVNSCVSTPVPQLPQVCPHVWSDPQV